MIGGMYAFEVTAGRFHILLNILNIISRCNHADAILVQMAGWSGHSSANGSSFVGMSVPYVSCFPPHRLFSLKFMHGILSRCQRSVSPSSPQYQKRTLLGI
jgi:hypothetical protein